MTPDHRHLSLPLTPLSSKGLHGPSTTTERLSRQIEASLGELTVGIAQVKLHPTRFEANLETIKDAFDRACSQKVDLLVFPELTIPGYSALDNFRDREFVACNRRCLDAFVRHTAGSETTVVIGFVDEGKVPVNGGERSVFYNSAAVVRNGEIVEIIDKTLLPNYNIFWETRYFESGPRHKVVEVKGVPIGIQICEDLWEKDYAVSVTSDLVKKGAKMIVNLSASPFEAQKYKVRFDLVQEQSRKHHVPFLYANLVGAQDGYEGEVVFDGRSMVCGAHGDLLAMGMGFAEDLIVTKVATAAPLELPEWKPASEIFDALVLGIRDYCQRCSFKKVYIGMSGGIDSAVTGALAVEALGPENVIGVTMPSHITSGETLSDAVRQCAKLGIRCDTRPIAATYEAWLKDATKQHGALASLTKQNAQARFRGQILMEYTNQDREGMVLTTGNKTETALGYMTLYGDMCGGLAALGDVSKSMVYDLARHINNRAGREVVLESIIERLPTAELEEGQTDRANLPADYPVLSPLVDAIVERSTALPELSDRYGEDVVRNTLRMVKHNEHKRRQAPPAIRISGTAFGAGRRYPVDDKFLPDVTPSE